MSSILKRKRLGITDYRKRYRLLKSGIPRLVVRITRKGVIAQVVRYDPTGDRILVTVTDRSLSKFDVPLKGNNTSISYMVGYAAGKKAMSLGVKRAILDAGRREVIPGGRIAAALKGFSDSGVEIPHSEEILPSDDRIRGKHLKKDLSNNFDEFIKKLEVL